MPVAGRRAAGGRASPAIRQVSTSRNEAEHELDSLEYFSRVQVCTNVCPEKNLSDIIIRQGDYIPDCSQILVLLVILARGIRLLL